MAHFAKVVGNKVTRVIVAEPEFFDTYIDSEPGEWVQTSYNTYGNEHKLGGTPLRGNFAHIGCLYDKQNDVFYEEKPFDSWTLNETTWTWEPPTPKPDGTYKWNESTLSWDLVE